MRRVRLAHVATKTTAYTKRAYTTSTCTQHKSHHGPNLPEETPNSQDFPGNYGRCYQSGDLWRSSRGHGEKEKEKEKEDKETTDTAAVTTGEVEQDTEAWRNQFSVFAHKFHRRVVRAKQYVRAAQKYPDCGIGFVSLSPRKGEQTIPRFDTFWNVNFAAISAQYNLAYPKSLRVADLFVNDEIARRAYRKLAEQPDLEAIRHVWKSNAIFPVADGKLYWWPTLTLWLLRNMPEFAAKFLLASYIEPHPPFYMVADCLEYLASHYFQSTKNHSVVAADYFRSMFYVLLDSCAATRPYISQKTVFLLATHSTTEQATHLHEALQRAGLPLHHETLLHFACVYAKNGGFQKALATLEAALAAGADPLSDSFLATCNQTLHYSVLHPDGYHASSYIVSRFLELGAGMNQKLYNVLIVNALAANDVATALRVFSLLEENKVEIGSATYSILLNGYKHKTDAIAEFEAIIVRRAHECALRTADPWLATEILHCAYLYHLKSDRANKVAIFNSTLAVYTRYFQIWPLRILKIDARQNSRKEDYFETTTAAINVILTAYLNAYPERAYFTFEQFSAYFDNTIKGNLDPRNRYFQAMRTLLLDDYTHNIFLVALSQDSRNLQACASLVQRMGKTLPPEFLAQDLQTREPLEAAKPTVQTWSILLHAFARHGQTAAAEKVMELMRKRGMVSGDGEVVNAVTWNSLIKGYALTQDIPGTVDALMRMEGEGFDADGYTTGILKKIQDREALVGVWKERRGVIRNGSEQAGDILGDGLNHNVCRGQAAANDHAADFEQAQVAAQAEIVHQTDPLNQPVNTYTLQREHQNDDVHPLSNHQEMGIDDKTKREETETHGSGRENPEKDEPGHDESENEESEKDESVTEACTADDEHMEYLRSEHIDDEDPKFPIPPTGGVL
ncbi:hypothetical protein FKW77_008291 [Venturia effusa]|uniref:Pentacotripeptide-repeat region of PRORP domain-containing protein n=1 Tax=Venturia effusa TaxID=50376 RepID=A0A517LLZ2_9PEZI|nr:hypothetical protein FKW77_008291 [Venturia effusa]